MNEQQIERTKAQRLYSELLCVSEKKVDAFISEAKRMARETTLGYLEALQLVVGRAARGSRVLCEKYDSVTHRGKNHLTRPKQQQTLCGKMPPSDIHAWYYRGLWNGSTDNLCARCQKRASEEGKA